MASNSPKPTTNAKLTYDYTLNAIKTLNDGIEQLRTRFTAILAFSGVLVSFGRTLPGYLVPIAGTDPVQFCPCPACLAFKILAYGCFIIAIVLCAIALVPGAAGRTVLPTQLLEPQWNGIPEADYCEALVRYLEPATLLALERIREIQTIQFTWAIRAIAAAAICLLLDEILGTALPALGSLCRALPG